MYNIILYIYNTRVIGVISQGWYFAVYLVFVLIILLYLPVEQKIKNILVRAFIELKKKTSIL